MNDIHWLEELETKVQEAMVSKRYASASDFKPPRI